MIRCQEKDAYASTNLSSLFKKKKSPKTSKTTQPQTENKKPAIWSLP